MFEFLVLLLLFGLSLWFLVPEEKPASRSRQTAGRTKLTAATRRSCEEVADPRKGAEQWMHSGRR